MGGYVVLTILNDEINNNHLLKKEGKTYAYYNYVNYCFVPVTDEVINSKNLYGYIELDKIYKFFPDYRIENFLVFRYMFDGNDAIKVSSAVDLIRERYSPQEFLDYCLGLKEVLGVREPNLLEDYKRKKAGLPKKQPPDNLVIELIDGLILKVQPLIEGTDGLADMDKLFFILEDSSLLIIDELEKDFKNLINYFFTNQL